MPRQRDGRRAEAGPWADSAREAGGAATRWLQCKPHAQDDSRGKRAHPPSPCGRQGHGTPRRLWPGEQQPGHARGTHHRRESRVPEQQGGAPPARRTPQPVCLSDRFPERPPAEECRARFSQTCLAVRQVSGAPARGGVPGAVFPNLSACRTGFRSARPRRGTRRGFPQTCLLVRQVPGAPARGGVPGAVALKPVWLSDRFVPWAVGGRRHPEPPIEPLNHRGPGARQGRARHASLRSRPRVRCSRLDDAEPERL